MTALGNLRGAPPLGGRPAIFIAGTASGIGRACAELFAGRGWFVGLYDVNAANPGVNRALTITALAEYAMSHIPMAVAPR
jgi:NAD(P)-dependent dehydrogenase (short-subunit alcohol dehydrogenase family)